MSTEKPSWMFSWLNISLSFKIFCYSWTFLASRDFLMPETKLQLTTMKKTNSQINQYCTQF